MTEPTDLENRCGLLRSLHVPGTPLVLPNAWDNVASARATAAAGFPVVATTSAGVAASLGYGGLLHHDAMEQFGRHLKLLPGAPPDD